MTHDCTKAAVLRLLALLLVGGGAVESRADAAEPAFQVATFSAEVTPPLGHRLLTGGGKKATVVDDPLFAKGVVLLGADRPIMLCSVDWAEIRNDAYDRWRSVLAEAVGTEPVRVLVSCIHQHDTPLADLQAERILREQGSDGQIIDLEFHERAVQRVARAAKESLSKARRVTHVGVGQAKAQKLASNRRYVKPDGGYSYGRYSSSGGNPEPMDAPEGTIDPMLKTLSFWDSEEAIAALSAYATHPMSYYSTSRVSADFPGLARHRRQADDPRIAQIYFSGASGNVTVGKYNDGSPELRPVFADRLYNAMKEAWVATTRHRLQQIRFRSVKLRLQPRESKGFTHDDLKARLMRDDRRGQELAALGLSWRRRAEAGATIDMPVVDLKVAQFLLLPAESYVEFQLNAQKLRPNSFVMVAGYGECAPGYIPIERAWREKDQNLGDWCWVAPGAERAMTDAIKAALLIKD